VSRLDAIVVGGGHNGLAAAAYLARAGRSVLLLERAPQLGGATQSARPFPGVDVRLSRFSYLVSLLPRLVRDELDLRLRLVRRPVASYTPGLGVVPTGGRPPREALAWGLWDARVAKLADAVRPTFTMPLPRETELRAAVGDVGVWEDLVERPLGEALERSLADDLVRGVVLTDALIGTETHAHDPSLRQNRCFLLHVAGGPWDVPVGGMGAVAGALEHAARAAGAQLRTDAEVVAVGPGEVRLASGEAFGARHVVAACAPAVLDRLRGRAPSEPAPRGSQLKVNLVLDRLPRLADGTDPREAFAGTFHAGEGYARLAEAHARAVRGELPDPLPCELYCHTLSDRSIAQDGRHTLTLFGLHVPPGADRDGAVAAALRAVQPALAEPLEDLITRDAEGRPCLEASVPADLEASLALPGGHIFHRDLTWPWAADGEDLPTPAHRWGVATDEPSILLGGAGARRGGGVSAIPGRSAAMAILGS
jgi:phytoene dehydrogenase-like protein